MSYRPHSCVLSGWVLTSVLGDRQSNYSDEDTEAQVRDLPKNTQSSFG